MIFETEGDTLAQTFKSEHGNYSDDFRKAFHTETYATQCNRSTANEIFLLKKIATVAYVNNNIYICSLKLNIRRYGKGKNE